MMFPYRFSKMETSFWYANAIKGFGPNVVQLDGETKKVQFEKVRNSLSDGETAWFRGLKGRDIPAQGNAWE